MRPVELNMDRPLSVMFTNGQYAIYDDARYNPVEGLHMYQCRDCGKEYIGEIKEWILVDFSGTIFTKEPLDESLQYYPGCWDGFDDYGKDDEGFCYFSMTPREFLNSTVEELEQLDRRTKIEFEKYL